MTIRTRGCGGAQSAPTRFQRARLGADYTSYGLTVHSWQQLSRHLPDVQWCDLTGVSDRLRSVKFPAELEALRQASAIADTTLDAMGKAVQGSWRVRDVAALAAGEFLRLGADAKPGSRPPPSAWQFLHAACEPAFVAILLHVKRF
ncbi:hypothetical protein LZ023_36795 (plasmid) [Pseudomonas silvicola]|nr:hypothetical protein LZ023_36795 [Pseudomonas silvicola]